jgi:hypothetical protein
VDIRDHAVRLIRAAFPEAPELHIAAHPGRFSETEVKRLANRTPAILTSLIGYTDEDHMARFVSWVLYRATSIDRLYDGALKLVSALIPVVRDADAAWSIGGGKALDAECLYSGTLDQINLTLWGVRWDWKLQETVFRDGAGGVMLLDDLEYFEGYEGTHTIGSASVEDRVNLEVSHARTD